MTADVCLDASVAVKWLLFEEDSDIALRVLALASDGDLRLVVPPHMPIEVTSAVYKSARLGRIPRGAALQALREFQNAPIEVLATPNVAIEAFRFAALIGAKLPYDSYYLALAEALGCELLTADREFYDACRPQGKPVRLLSDYAPTA